jgi:predicted RNA-binding Zn-ribbon protein involved in translation (DUF1610 family)
LDYLFIHLLNFVTAPVFVQYRIVSKPFFQKKNVKNMKIISRNALGDKVLGVFTCVKCTSKLEVQVKDCRVGVATDYAGDSDEYVGFNCPVCGNFMSDLPGLSYSDVDNYHKTAKAIEAMEKKQSDNTTKK